MAVKLIITFISTFMPIILFIALVVFISKNKGYNKQGNTNSQRSNSQSARTEKSSGIGLGAAAGTAGFSLAAMMNREQMEQHLMFMQMQDNQQQQILNQLTEEQRQLFEQAHQSFLEEHNRFVEQTGQQDFNLFLDRAEQEHLQFQEQSTDYSLQSVDPLSEMNMPMTEQIQDFQNNDFNSDLNNNSFNDNNFGGGNDFGGGF